MVSYRRIDNTNSKMVECDSGAADGGAVASGGDASGASAGAGIEGPATTSGDVLGNCDHSSGEGFFGPGCFHVPSRAKFPLHRWEVANGGSKRKKDKKGRDKKYAYEKGMKVVVDMLEDEQTANGIDKSKVIAGLKKIARGVKSMDDVKAINAKLQKDKVKIDAKISKSKYSKMKEIFTDFAGFIKDICTGEYKASWFAVSMVAVGLIYLLSPIDLVPDVIPGVGLIDDAFVLTLIFEAIKDEIAMWKNAKTGRAVAESESCWIYNEEIPNSPDDPDSYDFQSTLNIPKLKASLKTSIDAAEFFDWNDDELNEENGFHGLRMCFDSKEKAIKFALDRIDDAFLFIEDSTRTYSSEEDWEASKDYYAQQHKEAKEDIVKKGYADFEDGRYVMWQCSISQSAHKN